MTIKIYKIKRHFVDKIINCPIIAGMRRGIELGGLILAAAGVFGACTGNATGRFGLELRSGKYVADCYSNTAPTTRPVVEGGNPEIQVIFQSTTKCDPVNGILSAADMLELGIPSTTMSNLSTTVESVVSIPGR